MVAAERSPRSRPLGRPRGWQPWAALAGFAFLLHFAWEMLQSPLFAGMSVAPHGETTWVCLQATLGDVVLALAAYGAGAVAGRSRFWLERPPAGPLAVYLVTGLAATVVGEYLSVYAWGRWAYGPAMPTLLGIGLAPVLQWIVLPLLTLWLARRHLGTVPLHSA